MSSTKTSYPYSEATAQFMDMAGQDRPKEFLIPLESTHQPAPGDLGTLTGLQNAIQQIVARIQHPTLRLRLALLLEEILELSSACMHEDLELIARNVADVLYVTHSFPHSLGYNGDAVYDCVHKANMKKKMGKVRSDGKQLAPIDFKPPDIKSALKVSVED
jgi:predicted HAD superfamily Cof-like phosphohydrolase